MGVAAEQEILQELVSKWVSLGLEYANGAPDVSAMYIYASSEHGATFGNIYFEQRGRVIYPDDLEGVPKNMNRLAAMHDFLFQDLFSAEEKFAAEGIPAPTEYRIYYEPQTRKLDVQLSRELIYAGDPERSPIRGIEYWLGDRAPKLGSPPKDAGSGAQDRGV